MSGYTELLRLEVHHLYFDRPGDGLRVRPDPPQTFSQDGLALARDGTAWRVLWQAAKRPTSVDLTIDWEDLTLWLLTKGADQQAIPHITLTQDQDTWRLAEAQGQKVRGDAAALAHLSVVLDPQDPRDVRLLIEAVPVRLTYIVRGGDPEKELSIHDPQGNVRFGAPSTMDLLGGEKARRFQSDQAIVMTARPAQRFALQQDSECGPRTLIPVLPAPSMNHIKSNNGILEAEIYVTIR